MAALRSHARLTVRSDVRTRTGVSKANGTPWSMSDVEVLDTDYNKAVLNVANGVTLRAGEVVDCLLESATHYRDSAQVTILSATPAK